MTALQLTLITLMLAATPAFSDEITIFDMRKSLAMSDQEQTYRDYYINRGSDAGLKAGMIIIVTRKLPLYDTYSNRSAGDLHVKVGRVKLVQVQPGLAVARGYEEFSRADLPLLEDNYIMIGDLLDLASATMEKKTTKNVTAEKSDEPKAASEPVPESVTDKSAGIKPIAGFAVDLSSKAPDKSDKPVEAPVLQ